MKKRKKPVCKVCKGTKTVNYRGRVLKCGACSDDPLQQKIAKVFKQAQQKPLESSKGPQPRQG